MGRDVMCDATSDWGYSVPCHMVWATPVWAVPMHIAKDPPSSESESSPHSSSSSSSSPTPSSAHFGSEMIVALPAQAEASQTLPSGEMSPSSSADGATHAMMDTISPTPASVWVQSGAPPVCVAGSCQLGEQEQVVWLQEPLQGMPCIQSECMPGQPEQLVWVQENSSLMQCMPGACMSGPLEQIVWVPGAPSTTPCIMGACVPGQQGSTAWFQNDAQAMVFVPGASAEERVAWEQSEQAATPFTRDDCSAEGLVATANTGSMARGRGRRHGNGQRAAGTADCVAHGQWRVPSRAQEEEGPGLADCAQMVSQLAASGENRRDALEGLRAAFARLAWGAQGCRVAQAALDAAGEGEGLELAAELRGRIREALGSPHANFVVQRIVEVLPPAEVDFIVEELTGAAVETAQHRFGCRVLCRLLEHCPHSQTECLVKEILGEAAVLCRHSYGHYVVRHILELGTSWQKRALVEAFVKDPLGLASHRCGSSVVEHALEHASEEDRQVLVRALLRDANSFARLASTRYGSYVARTLSRLRGKDTAEERMFAVATTQKVRACRRSKRLTAHEQATRYEVSVSA